MEKLDRNTAFFESEVCKKSPCGEHHTSGAKTKKDSATGKTFYLCDYCEKKMHEVPSLSDALRSRS